MEAKVIMVKHGQQQKLLEKQMVCDSVTSKIYSFIWQTMVNNKKTYGPQPAKHGFVIDYYRPVAKNIVQ